MPNSLLSLVSEDTRINLFGAKSPYYLESWIPSTPAVKDGGFWTSSYLADGKQLVGYALSNVTDTFVLTVTGHSQDDVIHRTQDLRRFLERSVAYWISNTIDTPGWIEVRGIYETSVRYAVIYSYSLTGDANPFYQTGGVYNSGSLTLTIEHGIWQSTPPTEAECLPIKTGKCWGYPYVAFFNGTNAVINAGSDSSLDNLASTTITVEAWIRIYGWGGGNRGTIINKSNSTNTGWEFYVSSTLGLVGVVYCATTNAVTSYTGIAQNTWYHVAMTWDNASQSDKIIRLFVNGVQVSSSITAGVGSPNSDASDNLLIGNSAGSSYGFSGHIGWVRLSNSVIYSNRFTPPPRDVMPNVLSSTLAIWIREGQGTVIDNMQGTSSRDGTASNISWVSACDV